MERKMFGEGRSSRDVRTNGSGAGVFEGNGGEK